MTTAELAPERSKEELAIGVDAAGIRHAIYPTAGRALCGRTDDDLNVSTGRDRGPDCLACATTARVFDRIDRSAPGGWFRWAQEPA